MRGEEVSEHRQPAVIIASSCFSDGDRACRLFKQALCSASQTSLSCPSWSNSIIGVIAKRQAGDRKGGEAPDLVFIEGLDNVQASGGG